MEKAVLYFDKFQNNLYAFDYHQKFEISQFYSARRKIYKSKFILFIIY